jgi:hypothetical protein
MRAMCALPEYSGMLSTRDIQLLLEDLCAQQGLCLSPEDQARFFDALPSTPERFATAIFLAEGLDPDADRRLYHAVLGSVDRAFRRSSDTLTSDS